jgi:hypothetical protein
MESYKKSSRKWIIAKYIMVMIPVTLGINIINPLPLEFLFTGYFTILVSYFGINFLTKKLFNEEKGK